jgi:hypothetical protein
VGFLQVADRLIGPAVEESIAALDLDQVDAGAVQLARRYAALIDESDTPQLKAWALRWIGPLLLAALESLGATPTARARLKGGKTPDAGPSQLARLREARRTAS